MTRVRIPLFFLVKKGCPSLFHFRVVSLSSITRDGWFSKPYYYYHAAMMLKKKVENSCGSLKPARGHTDWVYYSWRKQNTKMCVHMCPQKIVSISIYFLSLKKIEHPHMFFREEKNVCCLVFCLNEEFPWRNNKMNGSQNTPLKQMLTLLLLF